MDRPMPLGRLSTISAVLVILAIYAVSHSQPQPSRQLNAAVARAANRMQPSFGEQDSPNILAGFIRKICFWQRQAPTTRHASTKK